MLSKLLLSAFISLSLRTANIPDQPTDYEYAAGIKSETTEISGYRERENGIIYDGFNYNRSTKYGYRNIIYKESDNIDSQSFALKYWGMGVGVNSQKWDHGQFMGMAQIKNSIMDISYEITSSRKIFNSKISYEMPLRGNFYLEPLGLYRHEKIENISNNFWQAKLNILYKFTIND